MSCKEKIDRVNGIQSHFWFCFLDKIYRNLPDCWGFDWQKINVVLSIPLPGAINVLRSDYWRPKNRNPYSQMREPTIQNQRMPRILKSQFTIQPTNPNQRMPHSTQITWSPPSKDPSVSAIRTSPWKVSFDGLKTNTPELKQSGQPMSGVADNSSRSNKSSMLSTTKVSASMNTHLENWKTGEKFMIIPQMNFESKWSNFRVACYANQ